MISGMLKWVDSKPYTRNLVPDDSTYWEVQRKIGGIEFRYWNPDKSKLAAFLMKKGKTFPFEINSNILYLGAASGTTVSHISDIIGHNGCVYCVEFAARSIRDLIINVSNYRNNIFPILSDARFPSRYSLLLEKVECIYCDVAQPEQARILADNALLFLKKKGWAILAIKAVIITLFLISILVCKGVWDIGKCIVIL